MNIDKYGKSNGKFSILINTHISRVEKLNLIPLREGKYPTTVKLEGGKTNKLDN